MYIYLFFWYLDIQQRYPFLWVVLAWFLGKVKQPNLIFYIIITIIMSNYDFKVFADEDRVVPYNEYQSLLLEFSSPSSVEFEITLRFLNIVVEAPGMAPLPLEPIEHSFHV